MKTTPVNLLALLMLLPHWSARFSAASTIIVQHNRTCDLVNDERFSHMYAYYSILASVAAKSNSSADAQRMVTALGSHLTRFDVALAQRQLDDWLADCWLPSVHYRTEQAGAISRVRVTFFYRARNVLLDCRSNRLFPRPKKRVYVLV